MKHMLSLFAGGGAFDLGLESTGEFQTVAMVENADYPSEVLKLRFPEVQHFDDVCDFDGTPFRGEVDGICGGFPCQDISSAGKGVGIDGERSGLWAEYARIIGEIDPEFVLIENVRDLLIRGFEVVVRDLCELGYAVEWDCLPAAAFGAWHLRDRVWIVGHQGGRPMVFGEPQAIFSRPAADTGGQYLRWPRAGYTTKAGEVLELEPLAPLSAVKGGHLLPTPSACNANDGESPETWLARRERVKETANNGNGMGMPLSIAVQLLPTPRAVDGSKNIRSAAGAASEVERKGISGVDPASAVQLLPTPSARDWKDVGDGRMGRGQLPEAVRELLPTPRASNGGPEVSKSNTPGTTGVNLATALMPTPTAAPHSHGGGGGEFQKSVTDGKGALNPDWVEWFMGLPIGWTDLECESPEFYPWTESPPVAPWSEKTPKRNQRLAICGNALVPPAPAWIGARLACALDVAEAA